jgi:methylamine---glutamate N-methyltransferase subunit C
MAMVPVAHTSEFQERKGKMVKVEEQNVGVFLFNGHYYAVDNTCPHQGCPLSDGSIDDRYGGHYIICACHGWEFNINDGKAPPGHSDFVKTFKTEVKDGEVYVDISLVGDPLPSEKKEKTAAPAHHSSPASHSLKDYLKDWQQKDNEYDPSFKQIQERAFTGKPAFSVSPMSTTKPTLKFDHVLFRGAQLTHFPLLDEEPVSLKTVIGKSAKKPLELDLPFFVSHMSFGALSVEAKQALAMGASDMGTAIGSGEGGLLPEERAAATKYIYEFTPAPYTQSMKHVKNADAIEIKFGQGTKPGMGGHLTKEKISDKVAEVRGIPQDKDYITPARFVDLKSMADVKALVTALRKASGGKPIGIKISAGNVRKDILQALKAKPDFITVDGRGGGTGASVTLMKDNYTVPTVVATAIAAQTIKKAKAKVDLIITGGLRDSMDVAKALSLGADAVALATASLIGIGCQQYRICHTGNCPVGITTHKENLRERFDIQQSRKRLVNFFTATKEELELIARTNGRKDIHGLSMNDVYTLDYNLHKAAGVPLP